MLTGKTKSSDSYLAIYIQSLIYHLIYASIGPIEHGNSSFLAQLSDQFAPTQLGLQLGQMGAGDLGTRTVFPLAFLFDSSIPYFIVSCVPCTQYLSE